MAPDTLTITDGEFDPPKKPVYSVSSVDAVVGEPIKVKELLVTDDPKVTIRSTGIQFEYDWEDYMTADFEKGIFTPIDTVQSSNGIRLTYVVEYDEDGDGYPEYQDSKAVEIEKIYATAADVPKTETPPVQEYGTAKVIVQNPDGREISKVDFKIRSGQVIPDPDGMFIIGFYDADGKSVIEANMENGKTYYAKTVAADDFEIHAGVNSAYGFVRMPNGNTMSSIHISADGRHYLVGDYLRDLNPDTEYTLYYKHGADGKVYSRTFRTAKQDYGIMLGHDFVTDANSGNLEQDGWHYDPDTKTLTLKNFTLNDFGADAYTEDFVGTPIPVTAAIASKDALTLNLIGDNRIANTLNDLFTITIFAEKDLTITGNGNLTLTGNAQYDLNSHTGNICLNGTGTLTFDNDNTAFYPEKGEVLYTNGTIVKIPKVKTSYNDKQYQLGSLIQSKDAGKLNFSDKVHDIKIEAAGLDGKYETVAESDLAALIQKNDDCEYEEEKSAIRITPVHKDVNKTATAETHESGTCDTSCTYHLSCDCGHIGEEIFIMSAEEHSLVKHAAKAATCEEPGTAEYWECEICGERYADAKGTKPITDEALTVPALGHKLTHHAGADATCTKAGIIEYWSCETCGERFADENGTVRIFSTNLTVPATGHDWVQRFAKPAACETDGVIAHWVCANCGQCSADKDGTKLLTKEEVTIKAFGHKWSEWTVSKAATETAEGEEYRTCSVCGEVETRTIPVKVIVTTTVPVTTTTAKAATTTAKVTTTTAKVTTTTAKATTTTAKATTTTAKATTTTAKATTTTAKATTTTAKATTTTAKVTTTTAKATTTTAKVTTTTAQATTTTEAITTTSETTTQSTTTAITSDGGTDTTPAQTTTTAPPEPEPLKGDVDGNDEVSVEDAQLALKSYTKRIAGVDMGLTEEQIKAADVNEDGELSVDDAQNILIYYVNNTVAGNVLTWEQLLGKQQHAQLRPKSLTLHEDIWIDADRYLTEAETS
ncbi:MAG: hypothetical protein VZR73_09445 [Acutalibacteraceae bacterium]|nr:hypothetical protein [Acutalibacteraceae bacterium]